MRVCLWALVAVCAVWALAVLLEIVFLVYDEDDDVPIFLPFGMQLSFHI